MTCLRRGVVLVALLGVACNGSLESGGPGPAQPDGGIDTPDAGPTEFDDLDRDRAKARFQTTTDLMRYVIAPGCAAENNECHSNEDFPDMSSEGNLWNLIDLPCNVGVGDRTTIEGFCEQLGDEIRVTAGANTGFTARIGSITTILDAMGEFQHFEILLDTATPQADTDADFEILRNGEVITGLGSGNSLQANAASMAIRITDSGDLPAPDEIRQGDENRDGVFGAGTGALVRRGDPRNSYLIRRLLGVETERIRMPLNENSDNPTEFNRTLTHDEVYAITSWINCMEPSDGVYSPIRYDCPANADNEGTW